MMLEMMAFRDTKTDAFMTPWFSQSVEAAKRTFADLVKDARGDNESLIARHPEDFQLWHVGRFIADSGRVEVMYECVLAGGLLVGGDDAVR